MPPKVKTSKEDIINAAVEVVRISGEQSLNARSIAAFLKCSTQPIFSNFETMEELRFSVVNRVDELCREYTQREIERGEYPPYKASGMAYIRFAKEERELFKLLYMRDRTEENVPENRENLDEIEAVINKNTGLSGADASLFHLEMWAYVHGIAVMFATGFFDLEWNLVSKMLTDAYQGLKKQYGVGDE